MTSNYGDASSIATTRRVIIIEEPRLDVSSAARHGALTTLFERSERKPPVFSSRYSDEVMSRLDMIAYDPALDVILLTGSIVALVAVTARLAARYGHVRVLAYSATTEEYVPIELGERKS